MKAINNQPAINHLAERRIGKTDNTGNTGGTSNASTTSIASGGAALAALALVLVAAMMFAAGCTTGNAGNVTKSGDSQSAVEEIGLTTRTLTLPAWYFADKTPDEVTEQMQEQGCTDVVPNEDGSYTITMPIDIYNNMVDEMHKNVTELLEGIPESEDYPSIAAIEYDSEFQDVTLTASVDQLPLNEIFVNWLVGLSCNMYQQIAGLPVNCHVTVVSPSGAEIQSGTYPDDFTAASDAQ